MIKVAVLGNAGMLGTVVEMLLRGDGNYDVSGFGRESLEIYPRKLNSLGAKMSKLLGHHTDYIINCIGAIKPTFAAATDPTIPIYTNAVFPHQLATWCNLTNTKLIHITTDCVFDGYRGRYVESDPHNPLDAYGKSKSLGETPEAMNIRTSIIGPEFGGRKRSFLEWIKGSTGEINGFTNHQWNGLTTLELAHCLIDIMDADVHTKGTFHVFGDDVSKYDLCELVAEAYGLEITVEPERHRETLDRTLRTEEDLNDFLQPCSLEKMISDLADFERKIHA